MPEPPWVLFVTRGCHLCDDAAGLLDQTGLAWRAQEVGYDEALAARYGARIPVLSRPDDGAELDWPFDAARLDAFVAGSGTLCCAPRAADGPP